MDQLGQLEGGHMGPLSSAVLMGLVGLVIGAWLGGLIAMALGGNERIWTGRGAVIGAALFSMAS